MLLSWCWSNTWNRKTKYLSVLRQNFVCAFRAFPKTVWFMKYGETIFGHLHITPPLRPSWKCSVVFFLFFNVQFYDQSQGERSQSDLNSPRHQDKPCEHSIMLYYSSLFCTLIEGTLLLLFTSIYYSSFPLWQGLSWACHLTMVVRASFSLNQDCRSDSHWSRQGEARSSSCDRT